MADTLLKQSFDLLTRVSRDCSEVIWRCREFIRQVSRNIAENISPPALDRWAFAFDRKNAI